MPSSWPPAPIGLTLTATRSDLIASFMTHPRGPMPTTESESIDGPSSASMLDEGDDGASETGPQRRCIVTGDRFDKELLIRFVISPDGGLIPDLAGTLPGRGLWVTADQTSLREAVKKRAFDRAARRSVRLPSPSIEEFVILLERLLATRCGEMIGLARRAGLGVSGFEKVAQALRHGRTGLLLAASDGAAGGRGKIAALGRDLPMVDLMTAAELGHAFGRDHVVHAMIGSGKLAARLRQEARRLSGFRISIPHDAG